MDRKEMAYKASRYLIKPEQIRGAAAIAVCYGGLGMTSKRRMMAITKSYEILTESYDEYRNRVIGHFGDQAQSARTVITILFTNETSLAWNSNPIYNEIRLRTLECYFKERLKARGWICASEIYDELGMIPPVSSRLWAYDHKYCDSVKLNVLKVRLSGGKVGYRIKLFPNASMMEIGE